MTYYEKIININTGEEIIRPYNDQEIAEVEKAQKEAAKNAATLAQKQAIRQSALAKLVDLGLTEEEIAAL